MTSMTNRPLPTGADLDAATAATLATLADPGATPEDIQVAAEHEQAVHEAYLHRPGGDAQLQALAEEWAARYETRAALDHAGNVFLAQGRTVDTAHVMAGEDTTPDLLYVGMTRGIVADVTARPEADASEPEAEL